MLNKINNIDCRTGLDNLLDGSGDMVVTSPPYWGKRNYKTQPLIWGGDPACDHEWTEYKRPNGGGHPTIGSKVRATKHDLQRVYDYKACFCGKCGAWFGDLGMEPTPELFVEHLLEIFDKVWIVLPPWGSVYVNLADSYSTSTNASKRENLSSEVPEKTLCCIPDMFKIGMVKRGWICRNELIWWRRNSMPESPDTRYTNDFEKIYFFVKSSDTIYWTNENTLELVTKKPSGTKGQENTDWMWGECSVCKGTGTVIRKSQKEEYEFFTEAPEEIIIDGTCQNCNGTGQVKNSLWTGHDYYFEQQLEPYTKPMNRWGGESMQENGRSTWDKGTGQTADSRDRQMRPNPNGRNKRAVWDIVTKPSDFGHFAVYPEELIETPIQASCPEHVCKKCGMPRIKITKRPVGIESTDNPPPPVVVGYAQCSCNAGFRRGTVIDPFGGSGTTAAKSRKMSRDFILFELNPEYCKISESRLAQRTFGECFGEQRIQVTEEI